MMGRHRLTGHSGLGHSRDSRSSLEALPSFLHVSISTKANLTPALVIWNRKSPVTLVG